MLLETRTEFCYYASEEFQSTSDGTTYILVLDVLSPSTGTIAMYVIQFLSTFLLLEST